MTDCVVLVSVLLIASCTGWEHHENDRIFPEAYQSLYGIGIRNTHGLYERTPAILQAVTPTQHKAMVIAAPPQLLDRNANCLTLSDISLTCKRRLGPQPGQVLPPNLFTVNRFSLRTVFRHRDGTDPTKYDFAAIIFSTANLDRKQQTSLRPIALRRLTDHVSTDCVAVDLSLVSGLHFGPFFFTERLEVSNSSVCGAQQNFPDKDVICTKTQSAPSGFLPMCQNETPKQRTGMLLLCPRQNDTQLARYVLIGLQCHPQCRYHSHHVSGFCRPSANLNWIQTAHRVSGWLPAGIYDLSDDLIIYFRDSEGTQQAYPRCSAPYQRKTCAVAPNGTVSEDAENDLVYRLTTGNALTLAVYFHSNASDKFFLVPAHPFAGRQAKMDSVRVHYRGSSELARKLRLHGAVFHGGYDAQSGENDIAVVKVTTSSSNFDRVPKTCLPGSNDILPHQLYGVTKHHVHRYGGNSQEIPCKNSSTVFCLREESDASHLAKTSVNRVIMRGNKFKFLNMVRRVVLGLPTTATRLSIPGQTDHSAVQYTNVAAHLQWIRRAVRELSQMPVAEARALI